MSVVDVIHKISNGLDKVMEVVIVFMLGAMVIITGAQIVFRLFFTSLSWSEEATRYLLIWGTMLGAGCVYKHAGHISITLLQDVVPEGLSKAMRILTHVCCIVLFAIIVWFGIQYFNRQGSQLSPSLRIPMRYVYSIIPIGAAIMFVHAVDATLQIVTGKEGKEEA